jgi:hypothetical protein
MTSVSQLRVRTAAEFLLAISLCAGCAVSGGDPGYQPNRYGVDFYEPFDNSRGYGPSYLVGPPIRAPLFPHDVGDGTSGRSIGFSPSANSAPSIPTTPQDPDLSTSPVQDPVH